MDIALDDCGRRPSRGFGSTRLRPARAPSWHQDVWAPDGGGLLSTAMSDDEKFEDVPEFESLSLDDPPKSNAKPTPEPIVSKPETPKLATAPLTPKKACSSLARDEV